MEILNLPIRKIKRDEDQPRQTFDEEKIKDMAQSIKIEGIINPIEIDKNYTIITGELRWRAAQAAGLKEVPCKMLDIKPSERFRRQVIENIHHNTMTDWDTGKALHKLLQGVQGTALRTQSGGHPDQGISKLARTLGKSKRFILDHLELQRAPKELQHLIRSGELPYTFIRVIHRAPEPFKKIIEKKIIAGFYPNRDEALEVVNALRRNPEKAEQLLKLNRREQIYKISPRFSDQVRESYNPVNELSQIVDQLNVWLQNNPPQTVGVIHAPRIILNLSGAVASINEWGAKSKQLNLK